MNWSPGRGCFPVLNFAFGRWHIDRSHCEADMGRSDMFGAFMTPFDQLNWVHLATILVAATRWTAFPLGDSVAMFSFRWFLRMCVSGLGQMSGEKERSRISEIFFDLEDHQLFCWWTISFCEVWGVLPISVLFEPSNYLVDELVLDESSCLAALNLLCQQGYHHLQQRPKLLAEELSLDSLLGSFVHAKHPAKPAGCGELWPLGLDQIFGAVMGCPCMGCPDCLVGAPITMRISELTLGWHLVSSSGTKEHMILSKIES